MPVADLRGQRRRHGRVQGGQRLRIVFGREPESGQYTQLFVSAPAGAVLFIHCAMAGI